MKGAIALLCGYALLAGLAVPALPAAEERAPVADGGVVAPPVDEAATASSAELEVVSPSPAPKQGTHEVAMRDIEFVPKTITVDVGDTITWRNEDSAPHNAIANDDSFRTATIEKGETASATIDEAGSHPYFCSIHAGMKGTVRTTGSGGGSGGGGGGSGGGSGGGTSGSSSGAAGSGAGTFPGSSSGTASGGTGSGSGSGASSLPATGAEDFWFALAGAWLLTVGAAIRTALSDL